MKLEGEGQFQGSRGRLTSGGSWLVPNFRYQVPNVAALPPILDSNRISNIATDMDDSMLSTATELARRSKCPRGAKGWFAGPDVEAEMNAA